MALPGGRPHSGKRDHSWKQYLVQQHPFGLVGAREARSIGSHCGGQTIEWPASASLLARKASVIALGMKVVQRVATTPMRKSAREPEACFFGRLYST
jgi:hypothetical protein